MAGRQRKIKLRRPCEAPLPCSWFRSGQADGLKSFAAGTSVLRTPHRQDLRVRRTLALGSEGFQPVALPCLSVPELFLGEGTGMWANSTVLPDGNGRGRLSGGDALLS